ncbi:MAG: GNAT family N-acetyltransferase [Mycobacteriaceae bacterium]|nr:GNAT family N-acetyltransferase [Mycobacteriaceae bacterium]
MTVVFAHVDPAHARDAFHWHRGFAAANDMLFPRSWAEYENLANDGRIVCATEDGLYLGLCYYTWDDSEEEWEVGGLMVDSRQRKRSLGSILTRVTLGHLLFEEEPLSRHERIISHVHRQNDAPRRLVEDQLGFTFVREITVESARVPGLPVEADGLVHGDLFQLAHPYTVELLALWCESWEGKLRDKTPAEIELFEGVTVQLWGQAFRRMAEDPIGL